jgi:hypothetical protein
MLFTEVLYPFQGVELLSHKIRLMFSYRAFLITEVKFKEGIILCENIDRCQSEWRSGKSDVRN